MHKKYNSYWAREMHQAETEHFPLLMMILHLFSILTALIVQPFNNCSNLFHRDCVKVRCITIIYSEVYFVTCVFTDDSPTVMGDPHFMVPLVTGHRLCYSIQGYPGLVFNLIYNHNYIINALFVDSNGDKKDTTWIGKLAIIPYNSKKSAAVIYDSVNQEVILAGCRTWCPTGLQHLCCKALINKIYIYILVNQGRFVVAVVDI